MTLLIKEGRWVALPESYHPISLLNVDYKVLTSILAERLNKILGNYISEDQTGFIRGRYTKDNIKKLMNIIEKV